MASSYSRKQFQKDLKRLAKLIEAFPGKKQSGGKRDKKTGELISMRTFEVVKVNGKDVTPHGNYQIREDSPIGPETAASKAAKQMCKKIKRNGGKHTDCEGRTLVIREKTRGSAHKHFGPYMVVVEQMSAKESKARTDALVKVTVARLVKQGVPKGKAEKDTRKKISKVTHRVSAKLVRK